jgi:superfamily II DNA/RNA helicase
VCEPARALRVHVVVLHTAASVREIMHITLICMAALTLRSPHPPRRCCRVQMSSSSSSSASSTFTDEYAQQMPSWLLERTEALGFESPTSVQAVALPAVLDGRDVIVQAKPGSGKTLTYMLPLIATLKPQASVQALVLLPTRELASQVALVARRLAAASPDRLQVMALLDGSGAKRQRKWLVAQPPQVVVGNVQQVDAVLQAGLLRLETLRWLVVDEVDACLSEDQTCQMLQRMLSGKLALPPRSLDGGGGARTGGGPGGGGGGRPGLSNRQTLFVSATLPQRQHFRKQCEQQRWCREAPLLVHAEPEEALQAQVRHGWAPCSQAKRVAALRVLLKRHEPHITGAIIFAKPSLPLAKIAESLRGIVDDEAPPVLSEDASLNARAAAVRALRMRERRLIISTPLGARGLDIPHCSHVYLLGLPESSEAYLHAAGRCGRMGAPGLVTTLAADKEEFALARLANALGITLHDARHDDGIITGHNDPQQQRGDVVE